MLVADDATTTYGQPARLTARLGDPSASGDVTFRTGDRVLCTAVMTGGSATCDAPSGLDAGTYPITAVHAAASDEAVLTVTRAATALVAEASRKRAPKGVRLRLVASGLPSSVTGEVTFRRVGGKILCRAQVARGAAACRTARNLKRGTYDVVAIYRGSPNHAGSRDRLAFRITG